MSGQCFLFEKQVLYEKKLAAPIFSAKEIFDSARPPPLTAQNPKRYEKKSAKKAKNPKSEFSDRNSKKSD